MQNTRTAQRGGRVITGTHGESVSPVRSKSRVIGIFCSDLHLTLKPPLARAGEKDWVASMSRPFEELSFLAKSNDAPIICAGDIFDHWRSPPELINIALEILPTMMAIPGQHDLPFHLLSDVRKSAFWTLVEAGKIKMVGPKGMYLGGGLTVKGFPWGATLEPHNREKSGEPYGGGLVVAVVHSYIWVPGFGHPTAAEETLVGRVADGLTGYDAAFFGDNHSGFMTKLKGMPIFNCGTLMRRKSDEINYRPRVGLLHLDGTVEPYFLDTTRDVIEVTTKREKNEILMFDEFLEELQRLEGEEIDFVEAMNRVMDQRGVPTDVRKIILQAME